MGTLSIDGRTVEIRIGDVNSEEAEFARGCAKIALDIETTGLDWREATIGTCQLNMGDERAVIVRVTSNRPTRLCELVESSTIQKIFHHAMFDLRFMSHHWGVVPANIACTKIASKLLDADNAENHSLESLVGRYLDIKLDKTQRLSDWTSDNLSREQARYAAKDVLYLPALLARLENDLSSRGLIQLERACFAHIPTRVALDLRGYRDIYTY